MLKNTLIILLAGTIVFESSLAKGGSLYEIVGSATNGLQPHLSIEKSGKDWSVGIDLHAQTNFDKNTWLKITNRIGSKLQVWLTNGVEVTSTNQSILTAMSPLAQTTVANIMVGVRPLHTRGLQWWPVVNKAVTAGDFGPTTVFELQTDFGISFTNDIILQIAPLIYKVETNEVTAHLVEFPPIKMKLLSNGEVQKLP